MIDEYLIYDLCFICSITVTIQYITYGYAFPLCDSSLFLICSFFFLISFL